MEYLHDLPWRRVISTLIIVDILGAFLVATSNATITTVGDTIMTWLLWFTVTAWKGRTFITVVGFFVLMFAGTLFMVVEPWFRRSR